MVMDTLFLKLGGSLLTDKTGIEAVRPAVLARVAKEIAAARAAQAQPRLVLGHGSGSFGHVPAAEHGTRQGVQTAAQWRGFADVSASARRLNARVTESLLAAGVTAVSLPPSAAARCVDGEIVAYAAEPVQRALDAGMVPIVFGDVAFDRLRGGTIVSTEEVLAALVPLLEPLWLLLAGETPGVLDGDGQLVPQITPRNFEQIAPALGGSRGTDVTGGMAAKVAAMLRLTVEHPGLRVRILSGLEPGLLREALLAPADGAGTVIEAG